jgi:S-adenosylmethionine uptake transporter
VGFAGVLLIVRPGAVNFNLGSVFVLLATLFYALAVMVTRKLQTTDSSATMSYYSSLVYVAASFLLAPLAVVAGEMPESHASIAFLFRAWALPSFWHGATMAGLGLVWAAGMYFNARAYSQAPASVVAPFEYVTLLISVMWGFLLWQEVPTLTTGVGAGLTLLSGLYLLYQDR